MYKSNLLTFLFLFIAAFSFGQFDTPSGPGDVTICEGESATFNAQYGTGGGTAVSFQWSIDGNITTAITSAGTVTGSWGAVNYSVTLSTATYAFGGGVDVHSLEVTVTNPDIALSGSVLATETNTSDNSPTATLTVNASASASISGIDLATVCSGDSPVFTATATGGTIAWTYSGTSDAFTDATIANAELPNVTTDGTATMTVTSASCGDATANFAITVTPAVEITSTVPNITTDDLGTETVSANVDNVTSATTYSVNFASATGGTQPSVTGFSSATNTIDIGGNTVTWTLETTQIGVNLDGFPIAKAELTLADGTANNFSSGNSVTFTTSGPCSSDNISFTYTALPVEFMYIKANQLGNAVKLDWATASELNNEAFYIERSVDGANFVEVGMVKGAGTSVEVLEYNFVDNAPATGTNYYRIRQVDFDGSMELSEVVEVKVAKSTFLVNVNPTAASNEVQIVLGTSYEQDLTVQIFDALGRNVMNTAINAGNNVLPVDVSAFQSGTYFIKLYNDSQAITKTFVKL